MLDTEDRGYVDAGMLRSILCREGDKLADEEVDRMIADWCVLLLVLVCVV